MDSGSLVNPTTTSIGRYTITAQALHWITAALMFVVLPIAWVMANMPESARFRGLLFTLHKSVGLTIVVLVAVRIAWRAKHPAPPLEVGLARWQKVAASGSHWMLYVVLVGMPISGYLLDAAGGYPISYFGLFSVPLIPKSPVLSSAATWLHVAIRQWLVYTIIFLPRHSINLAHFGPSRRCARPNATKARTGPRMTFGTSRGRVGCPACRIPRPPVMPRRGTIRSLPSILSGALVRGLARPCHK
jgi:cytochrome b561